MKRTASARLEFDVEGPAEFVLSVAASRDYTAAASGTPGTPGTARVTEEALAVTQHGPPLQVRELHDHHGTLPTCATSVPAGSPWTTGSSSTVASTGPTSTSSTWSATDDRVATASPTP